MSWTNITNPITLTENASSHVAYIETTNLGYNVELFDYTIQIVSVGAATSVTIDGLGPAGLWTNLASGKVAADTVSINFGIWSRIRLTWTGGSPDGTGSAKFVASRKFFGIN